jgi:N-formylglutamate amidohydrolase
MNDISKIVFEKGHEALLAPLLLDSPHSGTIYPSEFKFSCPIDWLKQTEDAFVDRLYADAPAKGIGFLRANFARSYIDVNRAETDIDPAILDGEWPGVLSPTERSIAGHGLMRFLCRSQRVYKGKISVQDALYRINSCYRPYHVLLRESLLNLQNRFGEVWHIDCHSMPSGVGQPALAALYPQADFIIGDRDGTSCEKAFTSFLAQSLRGMGYRVVFNDPYKGVEIISRYGKPSYGMHSIQLELSRALYMNEKTLELNDGFEELKKNLNTLMDDARVWVLNRIEGQQRLAAE